MSRFDGDGRARLSALPRHVTEGTHPLRISRAAARRICAEFADRGESYHSHMGGTMWVVREHCESECLQCLIEVHRAGGRVTGYTLRRGQP